jgi:hypothetical protein
MVGHKATAQWLPIPVALQLLGEFFKTEATLRYHVCRRGKNGLLAADAVRETPLGLRINPPRVKRWALGRIQTEELHRS